MRDKKNLEAHLCARFDASGMGPIGPSRQVELAEATRFQGCFSTARAAVGLLGLETLSPAAAAGQ
jgi:hypothetical protein